MTAPLLLSMTVKSSSLVCHSRLGNDFHGPRIKGWNSIQWDESRSSSGYVICGLQFLEHDVNKGRNIVLDGASSH